MSKKGKRRLGSEERAQLIVLAINMVKQENYKNFTLKELSEKLKKLDCPYFFKVPNILVDCGYIIKQKGWQYNFSSPDPIHYKPIQVRIDAIPMLNRNKEKKVDSFVLVSEGLTEEKCIQFLKEKGYKLQKPIVTYKEI